MRIGIGNHNSKPVYRVGILPWTILHILNIMIVYWEWELLNKSVILLPPFDCISQLPL